MIRPVLVSALKNWTISAAAQEQLDRPYATFYDLWTGEFSDRFYDMGTVVRLGTAIEFGLREFHYAATGAHPSDPMVFQRLVKERALVRLIEADCNGYRLDTNPYWADVRSTMLYRHLYAHRNGLVDDKWIADHRKVTGEDPMPRLRDWGYPDDDVYWFEPLRRLPDMIEAARGFFRELPD